MWKRNKVTEEEDGSFLAFKIKVLPSFHQKKKSEMKPDPVIVVNVLWLNFGNRWKTL